MDDQTIGQTIFATLHAIAAEVAPDEIAADQPLRDQVDLDSMDFLNFLIGLHRRLGIDIPEPDYAKLITLTDLVSYLKARSTGAVAATDNPARSEPSILVPVSPTVRAARRNRIDGEKTENNSKSRPGSHECYALCGPPLDEGARSLDAKERRNDSRDDDENAEDAERSWRTRSGCRCNQDKSERNSYGCDDIEADRRLREPGRIQQQGRIRHPHDANGGNDKAEGESQPPHTASLGRQAAKLLAGPVERRVGVIAAVQGAAC